MSDHLELSPLEFDALRELMNVGFGQAAVALSEVIDLKVVLTVPHVSVLTSGGLVDFIDSQVKAPAAYAVVEQPFFGNFHGLSFFLLPSGEEAKLKAILGLEDDAAVDDLGERSTEDEALVEIGNIVIGACVGKIAGMLKDQVSYRPPRVSAVLREASGLERRLGSPSDLALVFKTVFQFERENLAGFLFLVAAGKSIDWIRSAVRRYIEELG